MFQSTILDYVTKKLKTNGYVFNSNKIIQAYVNNIELHEYFMLFSKKISPILLPVGSKVEPRIISINNLLSFSIITTDAETIIIGPYTITPSNDIGIHVSSSDLLEFNQNLIPNPPSSLILELSLLLHNSSSNLTLSETDLQLSQYATNNFFIKKQTTESLFSRRENDFFHNSYNQEKREQDAIAEGNVAKLKKSWEEVYNGNIGVLSDNELRHYKNLAIVIITLASRSAMRGGGDPETCYSMSDSYIQGVERLSSIDEIIALARQAEINYTLLVKQTATFSILKTDENDKSLHPFIVLSKKYINQHLHSSITTPEIAKSIPCSESYLNKLFRTYLGKSVQDYIAEEKCRYAEDLLKYTSDSIGKISSELGFSSQSYFGKIFKKFTGYTPKHYRNKF